MFTKEPVSSLSQVDSPYALFIDRLVTAHKLPHHRHGNGKGHTAGGVKHQPSRTKGLNHLPPEQRPTSLPKGSAQPKKDKKRSQW